MTPGTTEYEYERASLVGAAKRAAVHYDQYPSSVSARALRDAGQNLVDLELRHAGINGDLAAQVEAAENEGMV